MATRRPPDDPTPPRYETIEEILAALPVDPRGSELQTAYDRLRDLGVDGTRANQLIRDKVNGTNFADDPDFGNSDSDGDVDPDRDFGLPAPGAPSNNPVINIIEDRRGGPSVSALGSGGSGRRPALRRPQDEGDSDEPVTVETEGGAVVSEDGQVTDETSMRMGDDFEDYLRAVAEEIVVPGEDGIYPDTYAVATRIANEMGLPDEAIPLAVQVLPSAQQAQQILEPERGEAGATTPEELVDIVVANGAMVSDADLPQSERASVQEAARLRIEELVTGTADFVGRNAEALEATEAAIDAAAEIWGRTNPGIRPDFSSVEEMLPAGADLDDVIAQGRQQSVRETATEIQGQTGADEDEALALAEQQTPGMDLFQSSEPDWLLQLNQGALSEQQKRRYVDYWNDAYGTNIRNFDELAPVLARFDGSEVEAQNMAGAVLADQEPLISHAITLPLVQGERKAAYTEEEMEQLRTMGFSNDAITRLVRLASITAGEDAIRPGAAGDTLNVAPLAALVRYYGGGKEFAAFNQSQQDIADLERELGLKPGQWGKMTAEERQQFRGQFAGSRDVSGIKIADPRAGKVDQLESLTRTQGLQADRGALPGILAANNNFRRGMDAYRGDQLLAIVHSVNPALARTVASTGGDPDKLDWQSNAAVFDILEQAGVIEGSNVKLRQLESATGFFGYFDQGRGGGGGGGGGAGPQRRLVDPAAVKEQVQQLWSRMFLADVDDAVVSSITANLQKQLDEAPEGMSFDVSARIMAFLKGQDVYNELYRNKPEGLSEEEYQSQFAGGVQDMIGNELDPEALKSGMRSGDYQTAVGRAASGGKLLTNSTLRGRWAQAKQTLDRFS